MEIQKHSFAFKKIALAVLVICFIPFLLISLNYVSHRISISMVNYSRSYAISINADYSKFAEKVNLDEWIKNNTKSLSPIVLSCWAHGDLDGISTYGEFWDRCGEIEVSSKFEENFNRSFKTGSGMHAVPTFFIMGLIASLVLYPFIYVSWVCYRLIVKAKPSRLLNVIKNVHNWLEKK